VQIEVRVTSRERKTAFGALRYRSSEC